MTATDERRQQSATLHNKLRGIFQDAERLAHDAVQADDNTQARVVDLEATIDSLRKKLDIAACECEQHRAYTEQLETERSDLRESNRAYARTLTAVRAALGAIEDADLVVSVRALVAEYSAMLAAIRAYKAAVDGMDVRGVACTKAALLAVLEEMEHAQP